MKRFVYKINAYFWLAKILKLMENTGDWLYYIIFLVIAVISLFNSAKKKRKDEVTMPPSPPLAHEQMSHVPPPPPSVRKKTPPPAPVKAKRARGYEALFTNEGRRVTENAASLPIEETNEASPAEELGLNDANAFRKAVVYSEILNRRY
ncbi:MAG: hypothetical protein LBK07_10270 [Tannerella sp.]|jgi:hypothetical protein|nr:hypothetical protein [Tannerella sp.]